MTTRLQRLEKRLINLRRELRIEIESERPSEIYINDLNELICRIEGELKQLKYAEEKPYEMIGEKND